MKSDTGEKPKDTGKDEPASLAELLVKQVPVALVAPYMAFTAAVVELIQEPTDGNPNPDQLMFWRWMAFAALLFFSAALTYMSYRGKAQPGARQPVAEVLGVTIAAAGWGFVTPESPLLAELGGNRGTATVLLIGFISVCSNLTIAMRLKTQAGKMRSRSRTRTDPGSRTP